jgi:hypothetical protein
MATNSQLYGLIAEFKTPEGLLEAARQVHQAGYQEMDAYSPYQVEGLAEAIGARTPWLSFITLGGGLLGAFLGYGMQWYSSTVTYPLNAGGKPYNSWPAFILSAFEIAILGAVIAAFFGMLLLNKLPELYHPVFNLPGFSRASQDSFFLVIEARDSQFDLEKTRAYLQSLEPLEITAVDK